VIGSGESDDTGGATRRRMYQDEAARLRADRRFMQFKPDPNTPMPGVMSAIL